MPRHQDRDILSTRSDILDNRPQPVPRRHAKRLETSGGSGSDKTQTSVEPAGGVCDQTDFKVKSFLARHFWSHLPFEFVNGQQPDLYFGIFGAICCICEIAPKN